MLKLFNFLISSTHENTYTNTLHLTEVYAYIDCVVFSEDWEGVRNLVSALPSTLKRIVLVSSVGVTKFNELPWR